MDLLSPFPASRLLVDVRGAAVTLSGHAALRDMTFSLHSGEHLVLRGGNGAGKSTLLRVLRGEQWLDPENGGEVIWYPQGTPETSPLCGRGMTALVNAAQQEQVLAQGLPVSGEDMIFGGLTDALYVLRSAEGEDKEQIWALASWLGAENLLTRQVCTLSQGELRLMLVARAMIRNPAILLLDEATDGLSAEARTHFLDVLEKASQVMTLVISTHRPETLPAWMRHEARLAGGRLLALGPVGALPPATELALSSPVGALPALTMTAAQPPAVMSGTPSGTNADSPPSGARITICNATVFINSRPVLHDLNWAIAPGENWAVLGDNGAGKSTLLRLLAGDETPACGGSITRVLPRQKEEANRLDVIRRGIRLVSDLHQATYGYNLCGEDVVLSGQDNSVGLYRVATPAERLDAARCMELLGVTHLARRSIRNCSTGEKRRLLLARALMGNPDLLLLDEPCSGLDPASRAQLLEIINQLCQSGVQFVLVTHHTGDIIPAVNRVLHLKAGRIVLQDQPKTFCAEALFF